MAGQKTMTKLEEKLNKLGVKEIFSKEIEKKIDETIAQLDELINKTIDGADISETDILKKLFNFHLAQWKSFYTSIGHYYQPDACKTDYIQYKVI